MRAFFDSFIGDSEVALAENLPKKLISEEKKTSLFLSKRDGYNVYFLESNQSVISSDAVCDSLINLLAIALKRIFNEFKIKKGDLVMVVGIGNEGLTADSLGAKCVEKLKVTAHIPRPRGYGRLCAIAPSVGGVTGIESFSVVKAVASELSPQIIICVDTLATKNTAKLGSVIQLKDNGLTPGAGVDNEKISLDEKTLGVPVIGIGVPLIIYARNILLDYLKEKDEIRIDFNTLVGKVGDLVVTAKEVDLYVDEFARIIGEGINKAVHGKN